MTKIINLFAGPGGGKSSIAAGLLHEIKKRHISCDAPYEFPKILAWDDNSEAIKDQLYVMANQHRGIAKSYGKVDYIIVDSPILLSIVYKNYYSSDLNVYPSSLYGKEFNDLILHINDFYDNINIFLERSDDVNHNNKERFHNINESKDLDIRIKNMLNDNEIPFFEIPVDNNTVINIIEKILKL